jgi:putative transposon-encoded protein
MIKVGDFVTLEDVEGIYKGRVTKIVPYKNDWMTCESYVVWAKYRGIGKIGVDEDDRRLSKGLVAMLRYVGIKLGLIIPKY